MSQEEAQSRPIMGKTAYTHPDRFVQAEGPRDEGEQDPKLNDDGTPKEAPKEPAPVGHDWEQRYRKLQSFQMKQENQYKSEIARLESNTAPEFKVPKTLEELEAFKGENPDLYGVVQSIAHGISKEEMKAVHGEVDHMRTQLNEASRETAVVELRRVHPDFEKINDSPEFNTWIDQQSADIQGWVVNNHTDASLITRALSLFKFETGWSKPASEPTLITDPPPVVPTPDMDVSVAGGDLGDADPRKHPKYVWSENEILHLTEADYKNYSTDIDLAQTEGRIALS